MVFGIGVPMSLGYGEPQIPKDQRGHVGRNSVIGITTVPSTIGMEGLQEGS